MKKIIIAILSVTFLVGMVKAQSPSIIAIGSQVWMTENLNVSQFNNGDIIPEAKSNEEWESYCFKEQACWCYYKNDPNNVKYGKLYNWYAVNDPRGLAPQGFHVPTRDEIQVLLNFITNKNGNELKSTSGWVDYKQERMDMHFCNNCANWNDEYKKQVPCHVCKNERVIVTMLPSTLENGNGKNSLGFNAKPGGRRGGLYYENSNCPNADFSLKGEVGYWWTSTKESGVRRSYTLEIYNTKSAPWLASYANSCGFSVRCIQGIGQSENVTQFEKPKAEIQPAEKIDWKKYEKVIPVECHPDSSPENFFKVHYKDSYWDAASKRFLNYYKKKFPGTWEFNGKLNNQCDEDELMKMWYGTTTESRDGHKLHEMGAVNYLVNLKVLTPTGDTSQGEKFFVEDKKQFPDQVK